MKLFAFALLAALMTVPVSAATAAPAAGTAHAAPEMTAQDLSAFFAGLVPYALHRADIPGGVIVITKDGKIIFAKGYGYADVEHSRLVDPATTVFRPGSVSKLFTWTAVMQLVQAGKIDLDADVNKYIDFAIPPFEGKPVTMRDLMTHTPGFEETVRDLLVDRADQVLPIDVYLKRRLPTRIFPPGKIIAYSNYGATLAGYIVQRVSGEKFEDYVAKHVFAPLKMTHSTFVQPLPAKLAPLMATGYLEAGADTTKPFEFVDTAPAGVVEFDGHRHGALHARLFEPGNLRGIPAARARNDSRNVDAAGRVRKGLAGLRPRLLSGYFQRSSDRRTRRRYRRVPQRSASHSVQGPRLVRLVQLARQGRRRRRRPQQPLQAVPRSLLPVHPA